MHAFVQRFAGLVLGILSGFDRLVFRGHLRPIANAKGMMGYLCTNQILLKDFGHHAEQVTQTVIEASLQPARDLGREIHYLRSSQTSKEDVARAFAARDRIDTGLLAVLTAVEPCLSFEVHRNRERRRLELQCRRRKCKHLYHYFQHPTFGFLYARLQTWFPFSIQSGLNGREWLARQLDQAGLGYQRQDNCFTALDDFARAQELFDQQLQAAWPELLEGIRQAIPPAHEALFARHPLAYYWSVPQSEWASDVLCRRRTDLETLYPRLVRHALTTYGCGQVLRFLGRRVAATNAVPPGFDGQVVSDGRRRAEGVRVKHWVKANSVKMYDKGPVLRIETTINEPHDFTVYRTKENDPDGPKDWHKLRKGIADLHRRAQVSHAANERSATALAAVADTTPLRQWAEPLCRRGAAPGKAAGRKLRALNPLAAADAAVLEAVSRPEFVVNGLRNRDLVALLYPRATRDPAERRRRSARVTRLLRLLRAHGLLHKVPKSHRYLVSPEGRKAITALLAARDANTDTLTTNAA